MDKTELQHIYNVKLSSQTFSFHFISFCSSAHSHTCVSTGNPGYVIVSQYGTSKITVFVRGKNTLDDPKLCSKH